MGKWRRYTPQDYVEARADIMRVARLCGWPDGMAPSRPQYQKHGRWSETRIRGMWGYKQLPNLNKQGWVERSPALGWRATVAKFGLRPCDYNRKRREDVLGDIHRVFGLLGRSPTTTEYRRLGRYSYLTVMRHFGVARKAGWLPVRDYLDGLENWRRNPKADVRKGGVKALATLLQGAHTEAP
jgi:hypothetical protein